MYRFEVKYFAGSIFEGSWCRYIQGSISPIIRPTTWYEDCRECDAVSVSEWFPRAVSAFMGQAFKPGLTHVIHDRQGLTLSAWNRGRQTTASGAHLARSFILSDPPTMLSAFW